MNMLPPLAYLRAAPLQEVAELIRELADEVLQQLAGGALITGVAGSSSSDKGSEEKARH
jgi:hypothetical protein